ncbi:MAG: cytochrome c [Candidatus Korobacteraceae bacterium]
MRKLCTLATVFLLLFFAAVLFGQAASSNSCSDPTEVAKMVNPVKSTGESLAQGKKYYGYDCAMCHGVTGNGKGEVDNGDKMPDFSDPAAMKAITDGQMFCALKTGHGKMPQENIRQTPNELWNLVNYVRSLAK